MARPKILIIHYNTPYLTSHLIKSIRKYTPESDIYIFENSDRMPLDASLYDDITFFDNTKGQYIDFDRWLEKYPSRFQSTELTHTFGSAKHCISVDRCMDLIGENFILLDSDILLKRDISEIFDERYIYVGEVVTQPKCTIKRVLPFMCFINVDMCRRNGIRYFDENMMHGLMYTKKNIFADRYDTGGSFYYNTEKLPSKNIKLQDYIVHYKGGSWEKELVKKYPKQATQEQWIAAYKDYWTEEPKPKNVVYTCITGGYDKLIEPKVISEGYDYVCFTDNPNLTSKTWKMRMIPEDLARLSNVKKQRCIKINPHRFLSDYEISVWVDGNITLRGDLNRLVSSCNNANIYIPKHPNRNCIYEEVKKCAQLKKDTMENMSPQIERYRKEGFPEKYGLVQSNIIIRKHNEQDCIRLMEFWWKELRANSHRDQLSFDYARWKNRDVKVCYLDKKIYMSEWFELNSKHSGTQQNQQLTILSKPQPIKPKPMNQQPSQIAERATASNVATAHEPITNISDPIIQKKERRPKPQKEEKPRNNPKIRPVQRPEHVTSVFVLKRR